MNLSNNLRELILRYNTGNISLSQFRDEFVSLFVVSNRSDASAFSLAMDIDTTYAELAEELISADEFKIRLENLARVEPPQIVFGAPVETSTCSTSIPRVTSSSVTPMTDLLDTSRLQSCVDCKLGQCERCTGIAEANTPWETACKCSRNGHYQNTGEGDTHD